jgi:PPOX class probable F420-dependent enzyme
VPVVFAQVGEALYTPIDGKPKRARQLKRVRNIEINSQAALLIDHYADDWRKLWWLRIDVTATAITEDATSPAEFTAALAALTRKYPQYRSTPLLRSDRMLLRMKVMNRVAWSASIDASL